MIKSLPTVCTPNRGRARVLGSVGLVVFAVLAVADSASATQAGGQVYRSTARAVDHLHELIEHSDDGVYLCRRGGQFQVVQLPRPRTIVRDLRSGRCRSTSTTRTALQRNGHAAELITEYSAGTWDTDVVYFGDKAYYKSRSAPCWTVGRLPTPIDTGPAYPIPPARDISIASTTPKSTVVRLDLHEGLTAGTGSVRASIVTQVRISNSSKLPISSLAVVRVHGVVRARVHTTFEPGPTNPPLYQPTPTCAEERQ